MSKITTEDFISKYLGQKIYLDKDKHLEIKIGQLELELKLSDDDSELLLRSRYVGVSKLLKEKFETEWHKAAWKPEHSYITFSLGLPDHPGGPETGCLSTHPARTGYVGVLLHSVVNRSGNK